MLLKELFEISARQIAALRSARIGTLEELLDCFPRQYFDMAEITALGCREDRELNGIIGQLTGIHTFCAKSGKDMTAATVVDSVSGRELKVLWMCEPYRQKMYAMLIGVSILVYGKITYSKEFDNYSVFSPVIFKPAKDAERVFCSYKDIRGISNENLKGCIRVALNNYHDNDPVPQKVLKKYHLLDRKSAYEKIHFPESMDDVIQAKKRFVFDDLLLFSLELEDNERRMSKGSSFNMRQLKNTRDMEEKLAYSLTTGKGQKEVLEEVLTDMRAGRRVDAVIQGDVGCGKSIVAFLLLSAVAENGGQAVMMASTAVLAKQHYEEMKEYADRYGYGIGYLDSNIKAAEKRKLLARLLTGEISILIGTHSVFGKDVSFKNLVLTIMDEEHKYGVKQRQALIAKGGDGVHVISMSATPIPRSLAGIIYTGNRKLYSIEKLPGNRLPVKTTIYTGEKSIMNFVEKEIKNGRQAYVICPSVEKNEAQKETVQSVEEVYEAYKRYFENKGISVGVLTGKTKKTEAAEIIKMFTVNTLQILISTTVVEVGVNVPNASVIVINNAERFGMASLHQLRGRVGRGKYQSYCILNSKEKENERLKTIEATTSGFEIAEADCNLRGAGNIVGVEQTGRDKYLSLAMQYPSMFKVIRKIAAELYENGEADGILVHEEEPDCR